GGAVWCRLSGRVVGARGGSRRAFARGRAFVVPAGDDQNPDQQQYRHTGNPTPHSASGALIAAYNRIAQPRIGKTWISHDIPPYFEALCFVSKWGNPPSMAPVPK